MELLRWIRSLFAPAPVVRDVTWLASGAPVDAVEEVVDTSGGPLKEHHRRRALRDPRLLPKRRRGRHLFTKDEARRLFSATMRTRNRAIRDLLPDEDQLRRYQLPVWRDEKELAAALGVSVKQLRFFAMHREAERFVHYITFALRKRSGGERLIMAPRTRLKRLQRRLHELLVRQLPVSDHAHGFRAGRSVRTSAAAHVGKRVVLQMDLKDFFPTVTFGRVRGLLVALGYGYVVATALAVLMTECERQPVEVEGVVYHVPVGRRHCVQGAPTSPGLCNSVCLRLDRRLAGLARRMGFTYTRYADDLTFSGDDPKAVQALRSLAARIIRAEGFEVNPTKTRVARKGSRQRVTGVTVNEVLGLSRKERRRLRAMAHQVSRQPNDPRRAELKGRLAYLSMLNPEQAARIRARYGV